MNDRASAGEDQKPAGDLTNGRGWTRLDASGYDGQAGVHDLGARLGSSQVGLLLVGLQAAERWVPGTAPRDRDITIIPRSGRLKVELEDGSTRLLDERAPVLPRALPAPVAAVTNVEPWLAQFLVIGGPRSSDGGSETSQGTDR
jgi:hypothetical protein